MDAVLLYCLLYLSSETDFTRTCCALGITGAVVSFVFCSLLYFYSIPLFMDNNGLITNSSLAHITNLK